MLNKKFKCLQFIDTFDIAAACYSFSWLYSYTIDQNETTLLERENNYLTLTEGNDQTFELAEDNDIAKTTQKRN